MKEENYEQNKKLNRIFDQYGVKFEGTGPTAYDENGNPTVHVEEADEDYNPYNQLGYGFQAYFDTLKIFGCLFVVLTIVMLPAFYYYAVHRGLYEVTHGYYNSVFMLGNMGFNKAVCVSSYVQLNANPITLTCESGTVLNLVYAGILPNNSTYDYKDCPFSFCGNPNATINSTATKNKKNTQPPAGAAYCTATYLRYYDLEQDFNSRCQGSPDCTFQITNYINFTAGQDDPECTTNPAKVYMQYKCIEDLAVINAKRE